MVRMIMLMFSFLFLTLLCCDCLEAGSSGGHCCAFIEGYVGRRSTNCSQIVTGVDMSGISSEKPRFCKIWASVHNIKIVNSSIVELCFFVMFAGGWCVDLFFLSFELGGQFTFSFLPTSSPLKWCTIFSSFHYRTNFFTSKSCCCTLLSF